MNPMMPPPGAKPKASVDVAITPEMKGTGSEGDFSCPKCGAGLRVEPVEESNMEHESLGMETK